MKKFLTTILFIGSLYMVFNYINLWANPFTSFQNQTIDENNEYYENFEKQTIINVAGSYLVFEDGETTRLSGISTVNENGETLLQHALINREVWIYRDGNDNDGISCVYLFIDKPNYPFSISTSLNRIMCSKNYAQKSAISNGHFSNSLYGTNIYFN